MDKSPSRSASLECALRAATGLLNAVLHGRTLDVALSAATVTGVTGITRAAAMDLAYSTLRDFGRGDFMLRQLMSSPPKEAEVRGLLLVALNRLEQQPESAHTTVDQAVDAAAGIANGRFKALTNGVLRNFLRRADSLIEEADADPLARWRHPEWWSQRLRLDHPAAWQTILEAGNSRPPMSLRINCRRSTSADFMRRLDAAGIAARVLENDAVLLQRPLPVDRLPGFADGLCSVQDAGAQAAASLLDAAPGMRVLDACAAPGGKTAHLLERADLDLLALDADVSRALRIGETLDRLGLNGAQVKIIAEDCRDTGKWWDGRAFDRILADAPCSASGVVRRHPDAKWLRRAGDIAGFARQQAEILDALWPTLAPGGKMLYATCSLFADENARQMDRFVGRHTDARRLPTGGTETELQLLPTPEHDGFFYALLEKH